MASLYDSASLVMIPSGYKEDKVYSIKPTDGSGDLAFSRSNDTATRVNSSGLIEKVRTNVQTYSQDFTNAVWQKDSVSITGGQTDPNGGTTAALATATASSNVYFYSSSTLAGAYSIYAKAGNRSNFCILNGVLNNGADFDLAAETATAVGQGSLAKIEDVGGGWYRCSVRMSSASLMIIGLSDASGGGMNSGDTMYFAFAQRESGDIATDYIATTSAAVSVGPVANLPRLDYSGGASCPKLLLEPQRTNLTLYSEQMDNSVWQSATAGTGSFAVTSANYGISPDGYQNADRVILDKGAGTSGGNYSTFEQSYSSASSNTALSVYMKSADSNTYQVAFRSNSYIVCDVTPEWQRFELTNTTNSSLFQLILRGGYGTSDYADILVWGCQTEEASYATSYIPTLSAASTRGADVASKTGISSLIGQTEGTIFVDFVKSNNSNDMVPFNIAGSDGKLIWIRNAGAQFYGNGTTLIANIDTSAATQGTRYKLAFVYGQNDFRLYRNGSLIGTDTSGTFTGTFSDIALNSVINQANGFNQILLFKTRLTDSEAIALTTI